MQVSLKDINRPLLVIVVIANLAMYYVALKSLWNIEALASLSSDLEQYAPSALLALVVGVLNSQLSHQMKARLVFLAWKNPLPGCVAFSKVMDSDDRIDPAALRSFADPLPSDPADQNRLWFKWYREFQEEPNIKQVHREYLFARDWTGLSVLLTLVLVPLAFWQMPGTSALIFLGLMLAQFLLVRWSARNHGYRFVASVLANKSSTNSE